MTTEIKNLQFADGVEVAAPFEFAKLANKLQPFVDDAAYEAANGPGVEGSAYLNTTAYNIRIHTGATWQYITASGGLTTDQGAPVGSIVAYLPGYMANNVNLSVTIVGPATNDVAGVNAFLPSEWRACDGSELNDPASPIFNGAGRYLPNLTDDRFLMGHSVAGVAGNSYAQFVGDPVGRYEWFKSTLWAPSGSLTPPVVTFNTNSLDSSTYQDLHYHGSGPPSGQASNNAYRVPIFLSGSYIRLTETTTNSWTANRRSDSANKITSSVSYTSGVDVFGNSSSTRSGFVSATYACSETAGSFSGNNINPSTTFSATGNYTPTGTINDSRPKYLTNIYIMRVK